MEFGSAVATLVPLWIFTPLILIGVVELLMTPKPTPSRREAVGSTPQPARA